MVENDLQVPEKKEVKANAEGTRNVPVFIPAVDIYESEHELTLLADMPGVASDKVEIDLNGEQLTIRGTVPTNHESGKMIFREYSVGDYYRQFTLSSDVDREKIRASIKDGVLKLVLPKAEAAKPRKIEVKSS